jgi:periplasmic protein CpxP/Spy
VAFMNNSRWTVWIIGVLVCLNLMALGLVWQAHFKQTPLPGIRGGRSGQGPGRAPEERHRRMMGFLQNELELTQEQMEQVRSLHEQQNSQLQIVHEQIHLQREAMKAILFQGSGDPNELKALAQQVGQLQSELEWARFNHFLRIKSLCSPPQKERFEGLINDIFEQTRPPHIQGMPGSPGDFNGGPHRGRPAPGRGPGFGPGPGPPPPGRP